MSKLSSQSLYIGMFLLIAMCLFSLNESRAETINVTLSGDAVCDNSTTPTNCEIINITPATFVTGVPGDSFVFDIIINNMKQIKLGGDVNFGVGYETNTPDLQGTGAVKFTQKYALSDENGDLITNVIDLFNLFFTQVPGGMGNTNLITDSFPEFDNITFSDVHSIVNTETIEGELTGTFEIRVLGVFLTSDPAIVLEPIDVPTLSEWGLIAMAGVLGIAGFVVIRMRKVTA